MMIKYLVGAFVIWPLFVLAQPAAYAIGLLALGLSLVHRARAKRLRDYASNIVRAQDRATAAFFGWSGRDTVSRECGREVVSESPCGLCHFLCAALDAIDKDHCRKEAS